MPCPSGRSSPSRWACSLARCQLTHYNLKPLSFVSIHQHANMGSNKPRGLQAARKLRTTRRENRWADKNYKKRALGKFYKTSPTGGSSHAKGIVLEKVSARGGLTKRSSV